MNGQVSNIVEYLKAAKLQNNNFKPLNFEAEQNPLTFIQRGYIDLQEDVAFRTMVDTANSFGNNYKLNAIWRGGAKHPDPNKIIWFPKLYENSECNNSVSDDDQVIIEVCKDSKKRLTHIDKLKERAELK